MYISKLFDEKLIRQEKVHVTVSQPASQPASQCKENYLCNLQTILEKKHFYSSVDLQKNCKVFHERIFSCSLKITYVS